MTVETLNRLDLAGVWHLSSEDGRYETTIRLPGGDVHSALLDAGLIPDPYFGENELAVRWVADTVWLARRTLTLDPAAASSPWRLVVDGLDTVATVSVNGRAVLAADSMFHPHEAALGDALRVGDNDIVIRFASNSAEAAARAERQPYPVPYSATNQLIGHTNLLRKVQCHAGWDWNLAILPLGLYGRIGLERADATRIVYVQTRQRHHDGAVDLTVDVHLDSAGGTETVAAEIAGVRAETTVALAPGRNRVPLTLVVTAPDLWWPAGFGQQPLYDLMVTAGPDTTTRKIGFRDLVVNTTRDAAGVPLTVRIGGHDIYCRGANWIPTDALPARITPENTRPLLEDAVAANMNMIRVWGGGQYEPDWFYDLCSELGLLVWQDMMFSCSLYPSDDVFLADVAVEIEHQVRRLSHHASIALWCGDNEVIGALTWFPESRDNRDRYLVAYDRLNRTIETAVKIADPDRLFWPSSPSKGPLDFGDGWKAEGSGDMHMWDVWHAGKSFSAYRDVRPRFASEFGFQSFSSLPTMRTMALEEDFNIASPALESHQRNPGGNARIVETISRYFRFPKDFDNLVYLSQVQQALAIQTAVDYWRSLKPFCMGTLYWQLNDTYPVASWSSLEYGGRWKVLHAVAKRFFRPVNVVAIPAPDGATIALVAVNDSRDPVAVSGRALWMDVTGATRPAVDFAATIPVDRAVDLARIEDSSTPDEVLVFEWTDGTGTVVDHLAPRPYKRLALQPPGLAVTAAPDGLSFTVSADKPAFFVTLQTDVAGVFSDNGFLLRAGESRTIGFTPRGPGEAAATLSVRDLVTAARPGVEPARLV